MNFTKVTAAIAALSITGINVLRPDEIPASALRAIPCLLPLPNGFVTNYRQERKSMGSGSTEKAYYDIYYTLTYRFLFMPVSADRGINVIMAQLLDKVAAIQSAILYSDAVNGLVDLQIGDIPSFGPLEGPDAKTEYHGCDIVLNCMEMAEVTY
jgi:hypothetical protein